MTPLKLLALDDEDLIVLSTHVQDALARPTDMVYQPGDQRFVMLLNRFDWESANHNSRWRSKPYVRRQSVLRIDKVLRVSVQNITPGSGDTILELLAVQFVPGRYPSGTISFTFAGEYGLRLEVECVEAELRDLGAAWTTALMPAHPEDAAPPAECKKH
jgi:hypothetical protein